MNDGKARGAVGRVLIYARYLLGAGGGERVMFEEARYLASKGVRVDILTPGYDPSVRFGDAYGHPVTLMSMPQVPRRLSLLEPLARVVWEVLALRRWIHSNRPDVIIAQRAGDAIPVGFATLFLCVPYVVHVNGTVFWFDNEQNLYKYSLLHRRAFDTIRAATWGHREFYPREAPRLSIRSRLHWELRSILMLFGVRRASEVINFTRKMAWEVELLYGKKGRVIRGAVPREALNYHPKQDIKAKLGLSGNNLVLNINRLEKRKRVELVIRAFSMLAADWPRLHLVIGGIGPESETLAALAGELSLAHRVSFVGFVPEQDLLDYYASCDVFVHPNWADHALAPYEALAMQKKVVWTTEMETEDDTLARNRHIFVADPTPADFAEAIRKALASGDLPSDDLSSYAWDRYCEQVLGLLREVVNRGPGRRLHAR